MSRFSFGAKEGLLLGLLVGIIGSAAVVSAWTAPSGNPPNGNVSPSLISMWAATSSNSIYYSAGNVGVGTANPLGQLQVGNGLSFLGYWPNIGFNTYYNNTAGAWQYLYSGYPATVIGADYTNGGLGFWAASSGTANANIPSTEALFIKGNGNIGIGTTTVPQSLTVAGGVYLPGSAIFMRDWDASTSTLNYVQSGTGSLNFCTANASFSYMNCGMTVQDATGNVWIRGQVNPTNGVKFGDGTVQTTAPSTPDYDSGWIAANTTTNQNVLINHNLGVYPSRYQIWFSPTAAPGAWIYPMTPFNTGRNSKWAMPEVRESTTQMQLGMYSGGYLYAWYDPVAGTWSAWTTGYIRVMMWK